MRRVNRSPALANEIRVMSRWSFLSHETYTIIIRLAVYVRRFPIIRNTLFHELRPIKCLPPRTTVPSLTDAGILRYQFFTGENVSFSYSNAFPYAAALQRYFFLAQRLAATAASFVVFRLHAQICPRSSSFNTSPTWKPARIVWIPTTYVIKSLLRKWLEVRNCRRICCWLFGSLLLRFSHCVPSRPLTDEETSGLKMRPSRVRPPTTGCLDVY